MATTHLCHVDCKLEIDAQGRRAHVMYAAEPSSAAGRYQWEQNRQILDKGRRAWRESGQGQSRECRVWDHMRRTELESFGLDFRGIAYLDRPLSRARGRHLSAVLAAFHAAQVTA